MQAYDVLDAAQEMAMAQAVERREIALLQSLLGHAPALETIIAALKPNMRVPREVMALRKLAKSKPTERSKALWKHGVDVAARKLQRCHVGRQALIEVTASVRRECEHGPDGKRYLQRVAKAAAAHDVATHQFMTANLRLVVSMARRSDRGLLPFADLIQEGNLGLMRAVERFDHRRGYRFSTYASWWIRHHLNRAISDKARLVRLPVHLLDEARCVARVSAELADSTRETPTSAELGDKTGLGEKKVALIQQHAMGGHHTSLDRPLAVDRVACLLDIIPCDVEVEPEDALDAARWSDEVRRLLSSLSPVEAAILRFRFGFEDGSELTLREIGLKYNLSRERIRQLQEQALAKLRSEMHARRLTRDVDVHRAA